MEPWQVTQDTAVICLSVGSVSMDISVCLSCTFMSLCCFFLSPVSDLFYKLHSDSPRGYQITLVIMLPASFKRALLQAFSPVMASCGMGKGHLVSNMVIYGHRTPFGWFAQKEPPDCDCLQHFRLFSGCHRDSIPHMLRGPLVSSLFAAHLCMKKIITI